MNCQFKNIDKYIYLLYSHKRITSSKEEVFDNMASRTTKTLTKIERSYYYKAIKHLDPSDLYVICDESADTLSYSKLIDSPNLTGRPTDEELTRALIIVNLIFKYNYKPEQLKLEATYGISVPGRQHTTVSGAYYRNDIAIKSEDLSTYKKLIEVKRITEYLDCNDSLIKTQLFDAVETFRDFTNVTELYYVTCDYPLTVDSFPIRCIGIDSSKVKNYSDWDSAGKPTYYIDIVANGKDAVKTTLYKKLPLTSKVEKGDKDLDCNFNDEAIRRSWRKIWDAIWGGTLESNNKFENFNKILLAKIYDERKTRYGSFYQFQRKIAAGYFQTDEQLALDIDLLYKKAYLEYFSKDSNLDFKDIKGIDFDEFSPTLVATCVEILHSYSFEKSKYKNVDILGEFYETVIRDSFKQTKGLFLTHPNIVLFILATLEIDKMVCNKLRFPDEDTRYRLPFIIDPSCGTGTFLVYYMNYVQKYIDEHIDEIANGDDDVLSFIERETQGKNTFKWVKDFVFGLDVEPVLATACQINQILHGDGNTNIYCADGLGSFTEYANLDVIGAHNILSSSIITTDYYSHDMIEKFDVIISNPPFNVNVNKAQLAQRFDITGKSEAYFLERWYQLLKPKGRIGVVLPESFFSVEDDVAGRVFLYKHFNIKTIVSLPNFTFLPHTNTSTSLLFAEKKSVKEEEIFLKVWNEKTVEFRNKANKLIASLPKPREIEKISIHMFLENFINETESELGDGAVIFPYFHDDYLSDPDNYSSFKKKIKDLILGAEQRWVLSQTYNDDRISDSHFKNYAVDDIGYKAGKKGSKDKPNELMHIMDSNGNQLYNVKYSHDWKTIAEDDLETVLGLIRRDNIWQ